MVNKIISFKKKSISENSSESIKLSVEEFELDSSLVEEEESEDNEEKLKVTEVIFEGFPSINDGKIENKSDLESILNSNDDLKLTFDDGKAVIRVVSGENVAGASASMTLVSDEEGDNDKPSEIISFNKKNKSLVIKWKSDIFRVEKQEGTTDNKVPEGTGDKKNSDQGSDNKQTNSQKKISAIDKKLKDKGVKVDELDSEEKTAYQNLKDEKVTEESKQNESENKIIENICKKAAETKFKDLNTRVNNAIKEGKDKDMKTLETELDKFINDAENKSKKTEAEALRKSLKDKISERSNTQGDNKIPWGTIGIISLIVVAVIGGIVYLRRNNADTDND